jgi:hypothetical protein
MLEESITVVVVVSAACSNGTISKQSALLSRISMDSFPVLIFFKTTVKLFWLFIPCPSNHGAPTSWTIRRVEGSLGTEAKNPPTIRHVVCSKSKALFIYYTIQLVHNTWGGTGADGEATNGSAPPPCVPAAVGQVVYAQTLASSR